MRLEVERKAPIDDVTEERVRSEIKALRSYGQSSFAVLIDTEGNYLQVGGGGVTCMLERRDATAGRHYRAFHDIPSKVFLDDTVLVFGGGNIPLKADEWFTSEVIVDAFCAFLGGRALPTVIKWRDMTDMFTTA